MDATKSHWWSGLSRRVLGDEAHLFLAYALLTFRPGASPPAHPDRSDQALKPVPEYWSTEAYTLFIEEARLDAANQQAEKRDIRARAQVMLTTSIVLGGAIVASYTSKSDLCACGTIVYGLSALATTLAALASGGIISARSDVGAVSVVALPYYSTRELHRTVAQGYNSTRLIGHETLAVLVTVLRDCVLALVLGAALLALAHVAL